MVSGSASFYEVRITKGERAGEILKTDIWQLDRAKEEAQKLGKKEKEDVGVFKCAQVFNVATGQAKIVF